MSTRILPDFVVIGARKSGTTWLDGLLRQHPLVHLPATTKELFFFDRYWDRGLGWYSDQFGTPAAGSIVGEVTPTYLHDPQAPDRLHRTLPDVRLAVVLRDPVDRAWSDFLHARRKGDVTGSLTEAIRVMPSIIEESRYAAPLREWTERVGDRLLILYFEDLVADAPGTMHRLLTHVGATSFENWSLDARTNEARAPRNVAISRLAHQASRAAHRAGLHRLVDAAKGLGVSRALERTEAAPMSPDDRALISELVGDDLELLRDLVPTRCPSWIGGDR